MKSFFEDHVLIWFWTEHFNLKLNFSNLIESQIFFLFRLWNGERVSLPGQLSSKANDQWNKPSDVMKSRNYFFFRIFDNLWVHKCFSLKLNVRSGQIRNHTKSHTHTHTKHQLFSYLFSSFISFFPAIFESKCICKPFLRTTTTESINRLKIVSYGNLKKR